MKAKENLEPHSASWQQTGSTLVWIEFPNVKAEVWKQAEVTALCSIWGKADEAKNKLKNWTPLKRHNVFVKTTKKD